jgi:hypothetical protein
MTAAVMLLLLTPLFAQGEIPENGEIPIPHAGELGKERFEEMDRAHQWKEVFFDVGTSEERTAWLEKWFLDGEVGAVSNEGGGMNLYHISYCTGSPFIDGNPRDYVRARRYMRDATPCAEPNYRRNMPTPVFGSPELPTK